MTEVAHPMLTKLSLTTKLLEDGTGHHMGEVTHQQTGKPAEMQAILGIQTLAREAMLRMLELM